MRQVDPCVQLVGNPPDIALRNIYILASKKLDKTCAARGRRPECEVFLRSGRRPITIFSSIVAGQMSMYSLLSEFSTYIKSSQFRELARHPDHARAFTREHKLPLPSLAAVMLSGMRKSIQAELDEFFAHLDRKRSAPPLRMLTHVDLARRNGSRSSMSLLRQVGSLSSVSLSQA